MRKDVVRNRAAIVDAAARAFAEHGLDAPLEPIASAAGVGNATLYRHFPARADLWDAVLREPLDAVLELVDDCTARQDPWDGFAAWLVGTAELEARRDGFHELMTTRFTGAPALLETRAAIQSGVEELFHRAQASGAIRADAVLEDLPLVQVSIARVIELFGDVAPEVYRRWVDLQLDALRATSAPRRTLHTPALRPNQVWRGMMRRRA
jgi:AcrR family transcriptional regulator